MPSRLPRLLVATGLAATVLLPAAACSPGTPRTTPSTAAVAAPDSTAQLGDGPATVAATPVATVPRTKQPEVVLADGRWPCLLKQAGGGTVSMDLIEFLTGDAAAEAYRKKYPDSDQETPDNDYFIVNDNTRLRTLPLAPSAEVKVVGDTGPEADTTIPAGDLAAHFGDALDDTIFWLTVEQGTVRRIEQQYVP